MADSDTLGERLETYVEALIESGRFKSRSDVLREGVRLIEERERKIARLDEALARAIADAEAGRVKPLDDVSRRLAAKYEAKSPARLT